MKIALVSPYDFAYPGGVNIHISRLEEHFTRMGHEVKIIAPSSRPRETRKNGDVLVFGRPIPIRASGSVVRSPVSPMLHFSNRIGHMLRSEKFDVIHIHEPLMPTLATSVLHHSRHELVIGTFHAFRARSWGYPIWKHVILNRWYKKINGRIAVSSAAKGFISKYFPGDFTIIPNGIDLEHFSGNAEPFSQFNDGKLNILFVGRMEKRKGFKYLLSAYELVKKDFPACRLIVVGPEDRASRKYRKIADQRGLHDIIFTGFVPYSELPRYYRSAHICCSPATGKESFGIILLEAMAAGRPVIASRIDGYADLVEDGVDALLVKPKDVNALAGAILRLLKDESLRDRMGAMGELKAGKYGWKTVAQQVMDFYQSLLKDRPVAAIEEIASAEQESTRVRAAR